jgi:hypothetical protein
MEPSLAGILVCCAILGVARFFAMPTIVALISSLAFGSTAIATLPALGGSSPMVFVALLMILLGSIALRRNWLRDLQRVFEQQPIAWLVLVLSIYTIAGAFVFPRLFEGEATVFVPQRTGVMSAGIVETTLGPVSGNVTQTLYFVFGALAFFAISIVLLRPNTLSAIKQGFFVYATLHVMSGLLDLFGKFAGIDDIFAPIRTASYAMATIVDVGGFWRIAGTYSEASAFGAATIVLLAFTFTYWRQTRSKFALVLTLLLIMLLILSTSTTAYFAGVIIAAVFGVSLARSLLQDQLQSGEIGFVSVGIAVLVATIGIEAYNAQILAPLWSLFDAMIFNKASSASGYERAYWNYQSLISIYDTMGLGIGLGSSRASSWIISVVSQFGVIGSAMIGLLTWEIFRSKRYAASLSSDTRATALSVRAAALGALLAASIGGGAADPGLIFFIALAVASSVIARASRAAPTTMIGGPAASLALGGAR